MNYSFKLQEHFTNQYLIWSLTEKTNTFWEHGVFSGAALSLRLCMEPPKDRYEIFIR